MPTFASQASLKTAADGGGAPKLDTSLPFVLSDQGSAAAKLLARFGIKDAAAVFAADWRTLPLKAYLGRAPLKLTAAASDIAIAALTESLAGCVVHVNAHVVLGAFLAPEVFAVAAGSEAAFTERDVMPSLRAALAGTRLVIMMPVAAVRVHGRAAGQRLHGEFEPVSC